MGYTDAHGRPELVMHPDIKRGGAGYRPERDAGNGAPVDAPTPVAPRGGAGGARSGSGTRPGTTPRGGTSPLR